MLNSNVVSILMLNLSLSFNSCKKFDAFCFMPIFLILLLLVGVVVGGAVCTPPSFITIKINCHFEFDDDSDDDGGNGNGSVV